MRSIWAPTSGLALKPLSRHSPTLRRPADEAATRPRQFHPPMTIDDNTQPSATAPGTNLLGSYIDTPFAPPGCTVRASRGTSALAFGLPQPVTASQPPAAW